MACFYIYYSHQYLQLPVYEVPAIRVNTSKSTYTFISVNKNNITKQGQDTDETTTNNEVKQHSPLKNRELQPPMSLGGLNRASSQENLSSGFPTKRVSKQSPQLQRLASKLKFHP